ncbi:MAG: response regulator [Deltaproteobacteria bacterium]|nr:response regulator [Deltaproteobacteria bacterium]
MRANESGTVLVVDDIPANLDITVRSLVREGIACRTASGGIECLEIVAREPIDLILLDLGMPVMDGWATWRRCASERKGAASRSCCLPVMTICRIANARWRRAWSISCRGQCRARDWCRPFACTSARGRACARSMRSIGGCRRRRCSRSPCSNFVIGDGHAPIHCNPRNSPVPRTTPT